MHTHFLRKLSVRAHRPHRPTSATLHPNRHSVVTGEQQVREGQIDKQYAIYFSIILRQYVCLSPNSHTLAPCL